MKIESELPKCLLENGTHEMYLNCDNDDCVHFGRECKWESDESETMDRCVDCENVCDGDDNCEFDFPRNECSCLNNKIVCSKCDHEICECEKMKIESDLDKIKYGDEKYVIVDISEFANVKLFGDNIELDDDETIYDYMEGYIGECEPCLNHFGIQHIGNKLVYHESLDLSECIQIVERSGNIRDIQINNNDFEKIDLDDGFDDFSDDEKIYYNTFLCEGGDDTVFDYHDSYPTGIIESLIEIKRKSNKPEMLILKSIRDHASNYNDNHVVEVIDQIIGDYDNGKINIDGIARLLYNWGFKK